MVMHMYLKSIMVFLRQNTEKVNEQQMEKLPTIIYKITSKEKEELVQFMKNTIYLRKEQKR